MDFVVYDYDISKVNFKLLVGHYISVAAPSPSDLNYFRIASTDSVTFIVILSPPLN